MRFLSAMKFSQTFWYMATVFELASARLPLSFTLNDASAGVYVAEKVSTIARGNYVEFVVPVLPIAPDIVIFRVVPHYKNSSCVLPNATDFNATPQVSIDYFKNRYWAFADSDSSMYTSTSLYVQRTAPPQIEEKPIDIAAFCEFLSDNTCEKQFYDCQDDQGENCENQKETCDEMRQTKANERLWDLEHDSEACVQTYDYKGFPPGAAFTEGQFNLESNKPWYVTVVAKNNSFLPLEWCFTLQVVLYTWFEPVTLAIEAPSSEGKLKTIEVPVGGIRLVELSASEVTGRFNGAAGLLISDVAGGAVAAKLISYSTKEYNIPQNNELADLVNQFNVDPWKRIRGTIDSEFSPDLCVAQGYNKSTDSVAGPWDLGWIELYENSPCPFWKCNALGSMWHSACTDKRMGCHTSDYKWCASDPEEYQPYGSKWGSMYQWYESEKSLLVDTPWLFDNSISWSDEVIEKCIMIGGCTQSDRGNDQRILVLLWGVKASDGELDTVAVSLQSGFQQSEFSHGSRRSPRIILTLIILTAARMLPFAQC